MFYHPHIHSLIPAFGLRDTGSFLHHPRYEDYLIPHKAIAQATRNALRVLLSEHHPDLLARIPSAVWQMDWIAQCQDAGRERSALHNLAAYVKKTAFHQDRLEGFDSAGRIILRYRDSADNTLKREALAPHELIRRWLLHVLPKSLARVLLSQAAGTSLSQNPFPNTNLIRIFRSIPFLTPTRPRPRVLRLRGNPARPFLKRSLARSSPLRPPIPLFTTPKAFR